MKKILFSFVTIAVVATLAVGATMGYFSDTETSTGNTFSAGTLDLNVDGGNANVVKFTVSNMKANDQSIGTWTLNNTGSVDGYVDLENIVVASKENGCNDAETEAGDTTCSNPGDSEGELQNLVSLSKLFWDYNCDGWYTEGDKTVFDGKVGTIAGSYDSNEPLNAGSSVCLTGQFNWWSNGADDNLGQGDSIGLGMNMELGQTTAQ